MKTTFKDLLLEGTFTGEPYISYEDMGASYSKMYSNWAKEYKNINTKLKGTGKFEINDVMGSVSKIPSLILYVSKNKKNAIRLTQEPNSGHPYLSLDIGVSSYASYSSRTVDLQNLDISTIKNGLKDLKNMLPELEELYPKYAPFNFPAAFDKAAK